jgi:hypothetical protein
MSYANMDGVPSQTPGVSEILASDWNTYVRDNFDSIKFGHIVCTSSTRPTGIAEGTMIYETDTNNSLVYNGSVWEIVLGPTQVLRSPVEVFATTGALTGTVDFDVLSQSVLYSTSNASGNWTLNVRGNSGTTLNSVLAVNNSLTVVLIAQQGSPAYYQSSFTIDGSVVTPKWAGAVAPGAGNANGNDIYTMTILKTAATPTYVVFANQARFGA